MKNHGQSSLVLVQPRNTRPFITERLLMGRKESNQTKQSYDQRSHKLPWKLSVSFRFACIQILIDLCADPVLLTTGDVNESLDTRGGSQREVGCRDTFLWTDLHFGEPR